MSIENSIKSKNHIIEYLDKYLEMDYEIIDLYIPDAPFDIFFILINISNKHNILIEYEKGSMAFKIMTNYGYVYLSSLTDRVVYRGSQSFTDEGLKENILTLKYVISVNYNNPNLEIKFLY